MRVAIASKNLELIVRLRRAIDKFENFNKDLVEVVEYKSYLELINDSSYLKTLIFTDESLVNSKEELHFIKILKNKNAAAMPIHIFNRYAPFRLDDVVVNSTSKFLKNDSNIEMSAFKSLSSLVQKEAKKSTYGL